MNNKWKKAESDFTLFLVIMTIIAALILGLMIGIVIRPFIIKC